MKRRTQCWLGFGGAAAATIVALAVGANAQESTKPTGKKQPDSGKFLLTIQGMKAGTSKYSFDTEGGSEATNNISVGGQTQDFKVTVKAKAGKVVGIGADAGASNHFTAAIGSGKANVSINDGQPDTQSIPAGATPFGNFSPHLLHYALEKYDAKMGGAQKVALLLAEGLPNGQLAAIGAKLTSKGTSTANVAGKPLAVTAYQLTIEAGGMQIDIKLYANQDRFVLAWDVPAQSYTAVKEGFEEVMKAAK